MGGRVCPKPCPHRAPTVPPTAPLKLHQVCPTLYALGAFPFGRKVCLNHEKVCLNRGKARLLGTLMPLFSRSRMPKQPFAYAQTVVRLYAKATAKKFRGHGGGTVGAGF